MIFTRDRSLFTALTRSGLMGLLALALVAGACAPAEDGDDDAPANGTAGPTAVPEYTIEQFMENTSLGGLSFSPDGSKILVSNDSSGVFNAYAYPVDGGEPEQLTESTTDPIFVVSWMPDGESILYSADQGGDELSHIYLLGPDGEPRDLTPGDELRAQFYGWARDRESFFVGTNERNPQFFDVYEYPVDGLERKLFYRNDQGLEFGAVSPDRTKVALAKPYSTSDSDVLLHDLSTGETTNLTEHEGFQDNDPVDFTPDGSALLIRSNADGEFNDLISYDLASGETETLVEADWDVGGAGYSENGKYLVTSINNDARTEVRMYDAETMERVDLPELPEAEITGLSISQDESKVAFYASTARSPRDLYVAPVGGGDARQLTATLNPEIEPEALVAAEVVRFDSYDGVEIPGLLYKPHAASAENKAPALIWIHGGPGGQSRVGYSEPIQYLVNHGYGVYAINNRGSSGYGKTFFRMDDRQHGEADLDDVVASKAMLEETGWVDPERICVVGGSYGGYLTLAALTFRPTEFACGVDLFGISNWLRTMENIPPWWGSFRDALFQEMGDPATDAERLKRISPLFHADRIERPLMVLQGANDPRVLQAESDNIVAAVKENGVPVEYVLFEDEGHGFSSKENRQEAWTKILAFLDRYSDPVAAGGAGAETAEPAAVEEPAA